MSLRLALPGRHHGPASSAGGLAALPRRLLAVAIRGDLLVDGPEIRLAVVVASCDVVDGVSARTAANVTDASVVAEDPLALSVPFARQPHATIAARPLPGSHASPSQI
jgi:hypothetical protein